MWLWLISGWFWFDCFAGFGLAFVALLLLGNACGAVYVVWGVNFCSLQGFGCDCDICPFEHWWWFSWVVDWLRRGVLVAAVCGV